jgi:hypothetical protein
MKSLLAKLTLSININRLIVRLTVLHTWEPNAGVMALSASVFENVQCQALSQTTNRYDRSCLSIISRRTAQGARTV